MSHHDEPLTYAKAGVSIEAGDAVVERIRPVVERTRRPEVLDAIGGFGGLFAIDPTRWTAPVMVTATDGVGTKLSLARQLGIHHTVGIDLVAMVVDDLVVSGAEPMVFLDYIAIGQVDQDVVADLVTGIAAGCEEAGCALVGGETAEHPGVMPATDYDLAGFGVGMVERDRILGPDRVSEGDVLIAMASSGLHSNGYSLVRAIVNEYDLAQDPDGRLGQPLGEALLAPTIIYTKPCLALCAANLVHAFCHITGGGLPGNLPRVLPDHLGAQVDTTTWEVPELFTWLCETGNVAQEEAFSAFNMGVGMVAVVSPDDVDQTCSLLSEHGVTAWVCGEVTSTPGVELLS
ncbi:phosphoribosylformylglycinamidine cyclo-ligase [Stomatohabitans albus]|uniref:phosphoribosylformylglycinamidine cyclo-ligase n=1 Tax=Stomatohabitans albus TaxID=3110766 RepID=UPI00300C5F15